MNREGSEVTSAGRAFQTRAPVTQKARCSTVGSLTAVIDDRTRQGQQKIFGICWKLKSNVAAVVFRPTCRQCSGLAATTNQRCPSLTHDIWKFQAKLWPLKSLHCHVSPACPHWANGDETAEHLLLLCPKWAAECHRYFGDSIDIKYVFQDYESLVEFLISSGHLSPHI